MEIKLNTTNPDHIPSWRERLRIASSSLQLGLQDKYTLGSIQFLANRCYRA